MPSDSGGFLQTPVPLRPRSFLSRLAYEGLVGRSLGRGRFVDTPAASDRPRV